MGRPGLKLYLHPFLISLASTATLAQLYPRIAQSCSRNGLDILLSRPTPSPWRRRALHQPTRHCAHPSSHSAAFRTLSRHEEEQACLETSGEGGYKSARGAPLGNYGAHSYGSRKQTAAEGEWLQPVDFRPEGAPQTPKPRFDWRDRATSRRKSVPSASTHVPLTRRVRPAEPSATSIDETTSLAIQRYSTKFLHLLHLEEAEDADSYQQRLATWPIKRLQDEGYCITGLSAYWVTDATQYGRPVASFELGPGVKLPTSKFINGGEVFISRLDPSLEPPMRGSVLSTSESAIRVCFKQVFDLDETWRLDMGKPGHTFERMRAAVSCFEHDPMELQRTLPDGGGEHILQGTSLGDVLLRSFKDEPNDPDESIATADSLDNTSATTSNGPQNLGCPFQTNGIFKDDQRIQSWARRHSRPDPVVVEGDPPLNGLNPSQIQAMAAMVGERFSLIQGPPGTGKTKVIIETIKLLKVHFEVPHPIVVCTYTNVALDNLVDGLVKAQVKPLRIGHQQSVRADLLDHLLDSQLAKHPLSRDLLEILEEESSMLAKMDELVKKEEEMAKRMEKYTDSDRKPRKDVVARLNQMRTTIMKLSMRQKIWNNKKYVVQQRMLRSILNASDVICTTCLTAACHALGAIDFPVVFIDEASMSTEPASLIPIMKGSQHVALIGDHKQLPPIICSDQAKEGGLGVSLFERLIEEGHVPSVMLDTQYRMHPAISRFPSKEFYNLAVRDGTVDAGGKTLPGLEPPRSHHASLSGSTERPAVIFLDHTGVEAAKGRSFQNILESQIVASVVEDLLLNNPQLKGSEIGIISPYAAQIHLLRTLFHNNFLMEQRFESVLGTERAMECKAIEVRTVDGFEGREKQVIVFSTVRNNVEGQIGFLADQKRLNVGITRAKRGLFVIGSISTLRAGGMAERARAQRAQAEAEILADALGLDDGPKKGADEHDATIEKKKAAAKSKARLSGRTKSAKGAESWRRYAEFLQESGLVVRLTGPSPSPNAKANRASRYGTPFLLKLGLTEHLTSLVWLAGPISGLVAQPVIGALSDASTSRYRRRFWIVLSTAALVISTFTLAYCKELAAFFVDLGGAGDGDWDDRRKDMAKWTAIGFAVVSFYILDFALNGLQASLRNLLLDVAPPGQLSAGNAWHGRMMNAGNIVGYGFGFLPLAQLPIIRLLGGDQFRKFCIICIVILVTTVWITCSNHQEPEQPRAAQRSESGKMRDMLTSIYKAMTNLPRPVRRVCYVQLFAFMGWFPFLFYSTTYMGQIMAYEQGKEPDADLATRIGELAMLIYSIVGVTAGTILPHLANRDRRLMGHKTDVDQDAELARLRESVRQWKVDAARQGKPLVLPVMPFLLRNIWTGALLLFSFLTFSTFFISTVWQATVFISLVGICWAVATWVPFAIIMELLKEPPPPVRNLRENVRPRVHARNISTPQRPSFSTTERSPLIRRRSFDEYESHPEEEQMQATPLPGGTVLGIHNLAIVMPQFIVAVASSIIFRIVDGDTPSSFEDPGNTYYGKNGVAWVLRFGGLCTIVGAAFARKVPPTPTEKAMRRRLGEMKLLGEEANP